MISVVQNLKNRENIVTGVKRMAAKRAVDYYRNEKKHFDSASCIMWSFSFTKDAWNYEE